MPQLRNNRHHLWWPRSAYVTQIERTFRELPCNIVRMDIVQHRELHVITPPPPKPSREFQMACISRHNSQMCGCYFDEKGRRL